MKKVLISMLALVMVLGTAFTLVGCKEEAVTYTATYGAIGSNTHSYLPYATVTVDKNLKATSVYIDELFLPGGKITYNTNGSAAALPNADIVQYSNPWHPAIEAGGRSGSNDTLTYTAGKVKDDADPSTVAISIAGEQFVLKSFDNFPITNGSTTKSFDGVLCFESLKTPGKLLSPSFFENTANLEWYVNAVKNNSCKILKQSGDSYVEDTEAKFTDGAISKRSADSTYQSTQTNERKYLVGSGFNAAMTHLERLMLSTNCEIPKEIASLQYGLRPDPSITDVDERRIEVDGVTAATFSYATEYLSYIAGAYQMACFQAGGIGAII